MKYFIDPFVSSLASAVPTNNSTNQYSYEKDENEIRRKNLIEYLMLMQEIKPTILLVSEAPGYLGMRRTGIPFSSEKIILTHPFFTSRNKFSIESQHNPSGELSAGIVWKTIDEIDKIPMMWPSFPFHPHQPNNENSNRKPTRAELEIGQVFLKKVLRQFDISTTIAVGRVAQKILEVLNFRAVYIRHPANGGATLFNNGMKELIKSHGL